MFCWHKPISGIAAAEARARVASGLMLLRADIGPSALVPFCDLRMHEGIKSAGVLPTGAAPILSGVASTLESCSAVLRLACSLAASSGGSFIFVDVT